MEGNESLTELTERAFDRVKKNTRDDNRPRYATVRHPTIEASIKGLFRFEREEQATQRLKSIADYFVLSKKHASPNEATEDEQSQTKPSEPLREVILWVRGYYLNAADEAKGALGHFAKITVKETQDRRYTLRAEKVPVEIKFHPQKRRLQSKHPNWGHPILRSVLKERSYDSVEAAAAALQMLHEEYPDVSIPTGNKLYIITYSRGKEAAKPVQKVVLEIKLSPAGDGSCVIVSKENQKPFQTKDEKAAATETKAEEASQQELEKANPAGYYTSMVKLKRKAKNRPLHKGKTPENDTVSE